MTYTFHSDAVSGIQVEVPTIDGRAKIKIPADTKRKNLQVKRQRISAVNSYEKGDQLIHVNVWTPQHVSAEEKAALEKMGQSPNFKPQPDKSEKGFFDKIREMFS
jgi:molecular chaperone DnaJ